MNTPSFALTIHHNILLAKDDRYALHDKKEITVVGVCVPVWCYGTTTSEPAREVFCRYHLKNWEEDTPIQILTDGYLVNIPRRKGETPPKISDQHWRTMSVAERDLYYDQWTPEVSATNLLDIKDGGCQHLTYREQNKIKKGNKHLSIMHYVNINAMERIDN